MTPPPTQFFDCSRAGLEDIPYPSTRTNFATGWDIAYQRVDAVLERSPMGDQTSLFKPGVPEGYGVIATCTSPFQFGPKSGFFANAG